MKIDARIAVSLICCCLALLDTAPGQDSWPRFRGEAADGVAQSNTGLPSVWSKETNVRWKVSVPGWGWSSPVILGDRVFLTSVVSEEQGVEPQKGLYLGEGVRTPAAGVHHWLVFCFDLETGEEVWRHEPHTGRPPVPRHPKSTYGTETPATDGERLYVLFGDVGLYTYDLDGQLLWTQTIEPRKTFYDYGAAASPVVHAGQVIMVYDNQEQSYIAAFDTESGDLNWKTERDEPSTWATPFVWENEFRTEIIVNGKRRNRSYSLDGDILWSFDGNMSNLVIPSPFAAHGLLYITSGYVGDAHRPVFAVRPGASGDLDVHDDFSSSEFIQWYLPKGGPYNPSPIVYGDFYYTLFDRGFMTCHDARTGKEVYGRKRFAGGATFTASPWAYDGKLFCLSEDGDTYVVKAGPEFELLHTNSLGELSLATPAVSRGHLLLRTASQLYCLSRPVNE